MPSLKVDIIQSDDGRVWIPVGSKASAISETIRSNAASASRQLAVSSPIYARIIDAILDAILPANLDVSFKRPLSNPEPFYWFWRDGPSALTAHIRNLIKTLFIDGELILKPRVNPADGRVTFSLIDPQRITDIEVAEGYQNISSVIIEDEDGQHKFTVLNANPFLKTEHNSIFFFRLHPAGYIISGPRGLPLLIAALDHISVFSEFSFRRISILSRLSTFYWEVQLEGASPQSISDFLSSPDAAPPEGGEVFAHNERVDWDLVVPDIRQLSQESEFWYSFLAGAAGLTPEFLGRSTGRDITSESLFTSIIHLRRIQREVFDIISSLISFQLEQIAVHTHTTPPPFSLTAHALSARSLQRSALTLNSVTRALSQALESNIIDVATASSIISSLISTLDLAPPVQERAAETPVEG